MSNTELAISPRNLGSINLPGYCPACLKFMLHLKFKAPYTGFGGAIFGDAQRCQEAILGHYFAKDGKLPKEFAPFSDCVERVECNKKWTKYTHMHESGVRLYGEPDEVLRRKDGSICIIDHKTAHNKGDDDKFHGQYQVQTLGYTYIAEKLGLGKASNPGLFYWSAQVEQVEANPADHYSDAMLWLGFKPSTCEIKLDYTVLDPLIKELKAVWNATHLPDGRLGCKDCKKRDLLLAIDEEYTRQDQAQVRDYPDSLSMRRAANERMSHRRSHRRTLLTEFRADGDDLFSHDGVIANWEYFPPEVSA